MWILLQSEQIKLLIFMRKTLERIFEFCRDEETGDWRIRTSNELKQLYRMPDKGVK